jgi:chemosensory pili system protein ChpA (sensor histidine kinase/response regulator)
MNSPSSTPSQGPGEHATSGASFDAGASFDTGPLSWVLGEIREALNRSRAALAEAVSQDADAQATSLRHAKTYLHQAHGALQIVDIDGVAIITETVEDLFDRLDAGQLKLSSTMADAIGAGYQALVEYLEEILSGMPHQPVRLFPYYRALLEVRGAERIHPADLFFPNLAIRPQLPPNPNAGTPDYVQLRKRFERALLPFLKSTDQAAERANATAMLEIVGQIEGSQTNPQSRSFWWVMHGLAEAVAGGHVPNEIYVKQLFARMNLQMRRLAQGSPSIAERLLRDALFFLARAKNPPQRVQQIRAAYRLNGLVPEDYDRKRYGQIDVDALAVAKDKLNQSKNLWNRIASGDANAADSFEHEMRLLAEAGARLQSAPLTKLLRELKGIARHAAHARPGDMLGLEMATSLLFVETTLGNIGRLPDNFGERADAMTARLLAVVSGEKPSESAKWLDDMSREAQQRQTMSALSVEMQNSLRQVEKLLDEYFRHPAQKTSLGQLDQMLHQIEGALAVLDQEDAVRTIRHTRDAVKGFLAAEEDRGPDQLQFQQVARNVGALSFFIESLQTQPEAAKKRFSFDDDRGVFEARLVNKPSADSAAEIIVDIPATDDAIASVPDGAPAAIETAKSATSAEAAEPASVQTVEAELARHQQQSAELAMSLSAEPDNQQLQEQLKDSLEKIRQDAALIDNPDVTDRAQAGIDLLKRADFSESSEALAQIITATVPAQSEPQSLPPVVAPDTDEAIDAELLEIFLSEAVEVLQSVNDTLPLSRQEPHNPEHLTTLRRAFHTLKGSGRMVGLNAFGEAAWSIEQVMNLCLAEGRSGDENLYVLLEKASEILGAWVQDLTLTGKSDRTPDALIAAAERIKAGEGFSFKEPLKASVAEVAPEPEAAVMSEAIPQRINDNAAALSSLAVGETPVFEMPALDIPALEVPALDAVETSVESAAHLQADDILQQEGIETIDMALLPEAMEEVELEADTGIETEVEAEIEIAVSTEDASETLEASSAADVSYAINTPDAPDVLEAFAEVQAIDLAEPLELPELDAPGEPATALPGDMEELVPADPVIDAEAAHEAAHDETVELEAPTAELIELPVPPMSEALFRGPAIAVADVIDFPTLQPPEQRRDDNVKRVGDLEISMPLYNIYLAETDDLVRILARDIGEWRHEPEREVNMTTLHAAHSLAGSSATVGFRALQEAAHALEMVLQLLSRRPVRLTVVDFDTMEQSVERMRLMLQKFVLGELPVRQPEFARLLESLQRDIENREIVARESRDVSAAIDHLSAIQDFDDEALLPPMTVSEAQTTPPEEPEAVPSPDIPEVPATPAEPEVPVPAEPKVIQPAEPEFVPPASPELPSLPEIPVVPEAGSAGPVTEFRETSKPLVIAESDGPNDSAIVPRDEIDADLLPVFLEEARDGFPQMSSVLRAWLEQPTNAAFPQSLLRLLHTLKGSARMAGAMVLGQQLHDMETRAENIMHLGSPSPLTIEDLLVRFDHASQLFDHLQNPDAPAPALQAAPATAGHQPDSTDAAVDNADASKAAQSVVLSPLMPVRDDTRPSTQLPAMRPAAPLPAAPAAPAQLVRVRADILDRLVNQAGEVSISRSKLETEVGSLRQSLSELTDNVSRLRDQLREIEMQAETQITSRMAASADREFDPLEFDRFTRLQELTRMMAESVSDVGSVHQNLARTLDSATTGLGTQARLTRELQQDLMRVRMVQFASISERLYRVTRQAAKEVDKRVNLDIRGSAVEVDRGVLERMTGPFEHLLRNAVAHGIESRESRRAAGKSETGELLVEIRQEGNEVVIRFTDDGQGLNTARIRDKASRLGLLTHDADLSDEEVSDLIFHPGFSTADEVTELAGRGIGMDVVRSEAAALGGRVATWSEPGKGAHFTIHLPLTLAVTQVVLIQSGGRTYAVPSVLVEQVQQLKTNALMSAYNDGAVVWQGQRVALHYLPALLGDKAASPVAQHYTPLLIVKSGNERVAIHVDEILGNREVVVKNIGPQLARMIGIAGATVLGSGDIVLILNPVPLAQRQALESLRAPRLTSSDAPGSMGAVAEMAPSQPDAPHSEPVQGLRMQSIIMVVDDSLTVRRVTQRLLVREGYHVVLAKDGVDALEHLQSVTPDVMLVDIEMPRMDGFDLTRNVKDDERTRNIPIVMITSRTAAKHRNYAMELGVNAYLGKPYREDELLQLIAGYVGKGVVA